MTNITNYTAIPREGLVGEWLLDGNANDTSGNGNNGTATDVTWEEGERGYVKECGSFNGSSSKIEVSPYIESQITGDLTMSIWFYVNDFTSSDDDEMQLFCINDSGESLGTNSLGQLEIRIEDDDNHCIRRFHEYGDGNNQYVDTDIIIGESKKWYNIVAVRDTINKEVKFHLDGIIKYTYSYDYNAEKDSDDSNNTQYIQIGYNTSDGEGGYYNGNIGLARIYNRTLNLSEINSLYQEGLRKLGPKNLLQNNGIFSKYSLPNLQAGLIYSLGSDSKDWSGNGNHGVSNGGVSETSVGLNNIYSFDSDDDYINIGTIDNIGTTDFTISASYYTTNGDDQLGIIDNRPVDGDSPRVFISKYSDNTIRFFLNDGTIYNLYSSEIEIGKWTNVVVVREGDKCSIYINGILNTTDTLTSGDVLSGGDWDIGTLNNDDDTKVAVFDGDISSVKIWNRALSPLEIQQLYYSNYIN